MAHLAAPSAVHGGRPWATARYRARSFGHWGLSWGNQHLSNQAAIYHAAAVSDTLFSLVQRFLLRRYLLHRLPSTLHVSGFGRYTHVLIKQLYLHSDWKVVKDMFSLSWGRLRRETIREYVTRQNAQRFPDFNLGGDYLPAPLRFLIEAEHATSHHTSFSEDLTFLELEDVSIAYLRGIFGRMAIQERLHRLLRLWLLYQGRVLNHQLFWRLFRCRWLWITNSRLLKRRRVRWLLTNRQHRRRLPVRALRRSSRLRRRRLFKLSLQASLNRIPLPRLYQMRQLCQTWLQLQSRQRLFYYHGSKRRIKLRKFQLSELHPSARFWLTRGRRLLHPPLGELFHSALQLNYCSVLLGKRHNVQMSLSARTLALYLTTKIRQGFSLRSIIRTWRRSINYYKGCLGWKICLSGRFETNRLRGRATYIWISEGRLPLSNFTHTERLDYYATTSISRYGSCGFKVWLYLDRHRFTDKTRWKHDVRI